MTDTTGEFVFRNLLPGTYDITATLTGFKELKQTGLPVSAGNPKRVDLMLALGGMQESVTVTAETTLIKTEKADLNTELTSKAVTNLPLNQYRNYQALLNLVPGRHADAVPERRDRHAGAVAADVGERRAAELATPRGSTAPCP